MWDGLKPRWSNAEPTYSALSETWRGKKKEGGQKDKSKLIIANSPQQLLIGMNEREVFLPILDALCDFDNLNIAVPLHCTACNYYTCIQYAAEEILDPVLKVLSISLKVQHTYTEKAVFLYLC